MKGESVDKFFPIYDKLGVSSVGEVRLQVRVVTTTSTQDTAQELSTAGLVSRRGSVARRASIASGAKKIASPKAVRRVRDAY